MLKVNVYKRWLENKFKGSVLYEGDDLPVGVILERESVLDSSTLLGSTCQIILSHNYSDPVFSLTKPLIEIYSDTNKIQFETLIDTLEITGIPDSYNLKIDYEILVTFPDTALLTVERGVIRYEQK